jgi:large subunit ribosomal protein L25
MALGHRLRRRGEAASLTVSAGWNFSLSRVRRRGLSRAYVADAAPQADGTAPSAHSFPLAPSPGLLYKPRFAPVPTPLEAGREQLKKEYPMAAIRELAAVTRSGTGKGAARSVRRDGRVPAVIYGGGQQAEPISVDFREINKLIYAGHFLTSVFELDLGGRKERVLPRDYQLDVITDRPVHVDFLRLAAGSRVRIGVPVHVANREASPGLKKGGAVNLVLHSVEVLAPADAIPESITIDLTGLDFHDSVHISAIKLPEGCKAVGAKADPAVVTIVPPTIFAEEAPAAAAATSTAAPAAAAAPAAGATPAKGGAATAPAKAAAPAAAAKPAAKPAAKK